MSEYLAVNTPMGIVKGRKCAKPKVENAKQVYRFAKIPFAKPPVGELRFEPPQKSGPWDGVLDGTKQATGPMQPLEMAVPMMNAMALPNEFGEQIDDLSEDCLYLNVYTPSTTSSDKLPVLFWIYGGGFQIGGQISYDGNVLSSLHDVVVVIPNYRVSCFGFLSFSGENSPCTGNMGLLDQNMALQWCKENVASFGGNPDNITLFGESAGSISVDLHVHSPLSSGLFHKAICHSGVSIFPMLLRSAADNQTATEQLLKNFNIEDKDQKDQLAKLKKIPAKELADFAFKMTTALGYFTPVNQDPSFFPSGLESSFDKVPQIFGANNTESFGILSTSYQTKGFNDGLSEEDGKFFLKQFVQMAAPTKPDKHATLEKALIDEYSKHFDIKKDPMFWTRMLGHLNGDSTFVVPSIMRATSHSAKAPAYFYMMTQDLKYNHSKEYNKEEKPHIKSSLCECDHGDDLIFTFGVPLTSAKLIIDASFTQEEILFSEQWMKFLVNFATSGNPNEGPYKIEVQWPAWEGTNRNYLEAHCNPQVKQNIYADRLEFWTKTFPSLLNN